MKLSPKQTRFVQEYLVDLCAAKAAIRAGYSERTAAEQGYQLLAKPAIQTAISEAQKARSERTGVDADRVVEELVKLAFADITEVMTWGDAVAVKDAETGEATIAQGIMLIPEKDLPQHARAAIAEVSQTRDGLKLKMHSKPAAIEMLAKHLGLYAPDRHEHTGKNGGPIETRDRTNLERAKAVAALLAKVNVVKPHHQM